MTALHMAADSNSKETAELLISRGANIDIKDNAFKTALHYAMEKDHQNIIDLINSQIQRVNSNTKDNFDKNQLPNKKHHHKHKKRCNIS
ncbi:hypothetical protein TVAG_344930 [Trichomonas vaginalis G3]|uniref:Uncharacterized protein n=1 Tax=Trichomonas vaginalis (strain ATCC PRA-98 / G3) TaxID=412133 RepID=A2F0U1_TRIV3|nr:spectrin binding [Trichomonas vaginalis G3]EAY01476.1 hypothetical protein TVAG_344930 [Trichomonas vaginalis G3]KAI5523366.1 spectrin binding [Trichomonas vaginalis G3]|eukprot:XP_001314167.1 hypothetical protein [Trichomonas vaginalis G3]